MDLVPGCQGPFDDAPADPARRSNYRHPHGPSLDPVNQCIQWRADGSVRLRRRAGW